jgi:hypothetical protein
VRKAIHRRLCKSSAIECNRSQLEGATHDDAAVFSFAGCKL